MSSNGKPANFPWLVPYLTVKDADQSLDFYQRAFGFEKRFTMPGPDGKTAHAEAGYKDVVVMFGPECANGGSGKAPATSGVKPAVGLYVYCDDVDALCKRAEAAGAKVERTPVDMFWGDRMCALTDPDGHMWSFATHTGKTFQPDFKAQ
jgi:uncharacterized glyoxalase superfamily protein PhnB